MSTIQNLFEQAQLAEAAYANFSSGLSTKEALIANNFSTAQADEFLTHWEVVDQYTSDGISITGDNTGFSATLFRNTTTGQYTFAVRGSTDPVADFMWADASLATGGIAIDQLVSMVNYVLRLDAGATGQTAQLLVDTPPLWPASGTRTVVWSNTMVQGAGPNIPLSTLTNITVTGHSLGGALVQMYQRIFGSTGVDTFNSVGIGNPTSPIFDQLTTMLGLPSGSFSSGTGDHLLVPGEIASTLPGTVMGNPQIEVFSETQNTNVVSAHLMTYVTDSLAVYNLLAKIDPTLDTSPNGLSTITDILKASSNIADRSLESTIAALGKVFMVPSASSVDSTNVFNLDRDKLYIALTDIQAKLQSGYSIVSLVGKDAATLTANAQSDIAYRYALVNSMPFVVTGADYNTLNAFGEFDVYDPATGQGTLTNAYLADRAAYLVAKLSDNTSDSTINTLQDVRYEDSYTSTILNPTNTEIRRVIFGSTLDENLSGANGNDSLFGDTGVDTLTGGGGADYLEGGAGFDTYISNTGDGGDTILDTDGIGIIKHNGLTLSGGENVAPNRWEDAQGNSYFLSDTPSGTQNLLIQMGGEQITVNNYHSGQLGITLNGEVAPTAFTQAGNGITVQGDRAPYTMPWDYWLWVNFSATWPYLFDSNGNIVRTSTPQPFFADKIFDTAGDDKLYAGDGLNVIFAYSGGNNHIVTGGNDDYIVGGVGRAGAANDSHSEVQRFAA